MKVLDQRLEAVLCQRLKDALSLYEQAIDFTPDEVQEVKARNIKEWVRSVSAPPPGWAGLR